MPDERDPRPSGDRGRGDGPRRGPRGDQQRAARLNPSGNRRGPAGIENAQRTPGAPPRGALPKVEKAPKPDLPTDERPQLPKALFREIKGAIVNPERAEEVALAVSMGSAALDEDLPDVALPYLAWAKDEAPRISGIREALGIAHYRNEDYPAALSELQAYRRISGRQDQNHVLADCYRAVGRPTTEVADLVEAMQGDDEVTRDRELEGVLIWASALADAGDVGAGRAVIRRRLEELGTISDPDDAVLRVWFVAGDLAERDGREDEARRFFSLIAEVDEDAYDVSERLARL